MIYDEVSFFALSTSWFLLSICHNEKEILLIFIILDSSGFAFPFLRPFFSWVGWGVVNYLIKGLKTAAVEYILYPQAKATKAEYGAVRCNACKPPIWGINIQFTFKLNAR